MIRNEIRLRYLYGIHGTDGNRQRPAVTFLRTVVGRRATTVNARPKDRAEHAARGEAGRVAAGAASPVETVEPVSLWQAVSTRDDAGGVAFVSRSTLTFHPRPAQLPSLAGVVLRAAWVPRGASGRPAGLRQLAALAARVSTHSRVA